MRGKILIILIALVIYFFPFDINIILNRVLGWGTHAIIYLIFVSFVIYFMKGKTLRDKIINTKNEVINTLK